MIRIENVVKRFDAILALDHVTARISEGSIFGLVGTNGAGKSTLLRGSQRCPAAGGRERNDR